MAGIVGGILCNGWEDYGIEDGEVNEVGISNQSLTL